MEQMLKTELMNVGITPDDGLNPAGADGTAPKAVPQDFYLFRDYAEEKVRFAGIAAVIQSAWNLTLFYKIMYQEDMLYPGDCKDAVYFHAKSGRMIFADSEGVKKMGAVCDPSERVNAYRAPELTLEKEKVYTQDTENWTLGVFLYELFFHSETPFRGMESMKQAFLSPEEEYLWMAEKGIFTMEDDLCRNRPVHGVQDKLVKFWEYYPEDLRKEFTGIFVDGKEEPEKRKNPKQWLVMINRLKTEYLTCGCGARGFAQQFEKNGGEHRKCGNCGNVFYAFSSGKNRLYLTDKVKLFQWQITPEDAENDQCIGVVLENRNRKGLFGIKNMSTVSWTGIFPDGGERVIEPGGVIPVWRGLTVTFAPGCVWQIEETRKEEPEKKEIPVPADDLDEEEDQDTLDDIDILEDIDISEDTDAADDTDEADEEGQEEMTYGFGC